MHYKLIMLVSFTNYKILTSLILFGLLVSCASKKDNNREEQISSHTEIATTDSFANSINGSVSLKQLTTLTNSVILTGLREHRLVPIYKYQNREKDKDKNFSYFSKDYYNSTTSESVEHFMPGIDILYGYNLLNISHYDFKTEKSNYLFDRPVLIKTLYYPSVLQDSLDKKPINRNYYLVSVYDKDTNKDSLINKHDLRQFYHFDETCATKTLLVPADYSVLHSQYDFQNDVMYVFAKQDANKNGTGDVAEPIHIFWINLKIPLQAKKMY